MKRRITSILVVLSMALSMMPFFALPASAAITPTQPAGTGTESDPYRIGTAAELFWFRDSINNRSISLSSNAVLTNNIDTTLYGDWSYISPSNAAYGGTFDGKNHTIKYKNTTHNGLFAYCNGATIKNLHAVIPDGNTGGMFAGYPTNCTFYNISLTGHVLGGHGGATISYSPVNCTYTACFFKGTMTGNYSSGGFLGILYMGGTTVMDRCYSECDIVDDTYGQTAFTAGLVVANGWRGHSATSTLRINDCYFAGSLNSRDQPASVVGAVISGSATLNRVHAYNTNPPTRSGSLGMNYVRNLTASSSGADASTNTGLCYLSEGDYTNETNFPTYKFSASDGTPAVWEMGEKYPILKQYVDFETEENRTLYAYENEDAEFNLWENFYVVLDKNQNYEQKNRFQYSIKSGDKVTKEVYDSSTMSYDNKEVTVAAVEGDKLVVNDGVEFGEYPMTIKAVDPDEGGYGEFEFDVTVVVKRRVPEPKVLEDDISYSRSQTLSRIPVTAGWYWVDGTICPKNNPEAKYKDGYKIYYPCESWIDADNYETYYDLTTLISAGFTVTYDAETNSFVTTLPVNVKESDESPQSMTITVLNADYPDSSPKPIPNATVTGDYEDEFPDGHITDEKGEVYAEISPGTTELTVSADGYQDKSELVEIVKGSNQPVVKLVPVRTEFTASPVRIQGTNEDVPDARVSITRLTDTIYDTPAEAWNSGADSLTCDAEHVFELPDGFPDGRYMLKNATYGWSHDGVVYAKVADGKVEYFEDSLCKNRCAEQTTGKIIYATKLSEPIYYLEINRAGDGDATHYVASVRLKNIAATYGTFGISWDPELFKLGKVTLGSSIKSAKTPEKMYDGADLSMEEYSKKGYYAFLWSAGDNTSAVLDTEMAEAEIATFDMYLNDASLADMLTVDSFSIVRWTDVKAARDWAAAGKKASSSFTPKFWQYWRECDSDNIRTNLQEGRIDATKSVVNGVEMNGFFQAAINGAVGDDNPSSFYDVMTDLQYGFPIKNSVIRFHVIDLYSGDEVEGAKVKLFDDTATKLLQSKSTAYTGRANFTVNTADKADPRFAYEVTRTGYWPLPLSQLDTDRPFVRTTTGKATEVEVRLDKKVYHDTVIARNDDSEAQQTIELVKSADLSGERYAYNGREFHFRVKGAKGYRITKYPTRAWVSIGDENAGDTRFKDIELEPSASGLFTLDAKYLIQDSLTKEYMEDVLGYEDVGEQPDSEGYRSYNIEVKFDKFEVIELDYLVEGMTGEHGQVAYNHAVPAYEGTYQGLEPYFPSPYTEGDYTTDIKIRTHKSQKDTSTEPATTIPANHKTGTFTFKADEGYVVERVYINGLQTSIYDDLTTFDYSFGEVDKDCSIIVMFWDGETPSKDTVLTLVVGDWGYVDTLSPKEEEDLICTRRTYLNPTESLVFTTNADKLSTDYELYMVERELEGDKRVDITDKAVDGKYTVEPVEGKNVIAYVTFKNKKAEITPTLFVKSYVYSGQGVADPAGILIYNFFDSVEIDLVADSENKWLARGVMLSPYDDLTKTSEYEFETKLAKNTYRYDSLQESIAIGSVFMEKAYPIEGYIDLGQKSDVSGAPLSGAVVKFVRLDDTTKEEKPKQVPFYTDSTSVRSNSKFEMELPAGYWNVYVMKQGYVTYKITNFKMDTVSEGDVRHFGYGNGEQHKIVPMIGSTRSGDSVTLEDAADVKSGMRKGVSSEVFNMTDVDNSGQVNYIDLAYVWFNYNKYMFEQDYMDFEANGSKDVEKMTTPVAPTET